VPGRAVAMYGVVLEYITETTAPPKAGLNCANLPPATSRSTQSAASLGFSLAAAQAKSR
jgi:hypothetical protein